MKWTYYRLSALLVPLVCVAALLTVHLTLPKAKDGAKPDPTLRWLAAALVFVTVVMLLILIFDVRL